MASRRAGAETTNDTEVDSVVETLQEMSGARGPDACIDAVGMEAHGTGIEDTYDRVKRALGRHTDCGEKPREAMGQSPADLFGCSHMLGGFADVGPTKVTHGGARATGRRRIDIGTITRRGRATMVTLRVNGTSRAVDVDPDTPLLWVLRDDLRLTGTKFGCGVAQCGACTVHIDGHAVRSCVTPVGAVQDREVVTIEGVSGEVAQAVQDAWRRLDVLQCGYCQSGQIMSAIALLAEVARPSDADIDAAMTGNVCRCATYVRIRAAIHEAAKTLGG
jgi:isoquinoline 1-oxidoreductase subunit alpha